MLYEKKIRLNFYKLFLLFNLLVLSVATNSIAQDKKFEPTINPQIWGHVSITDNGSDDKGFSGYIKRMRIGAKGDVFENIGYAYLFETVSSAKLLQAWIDYKFFKPLQVRVGQFKYPFGMESYSSATTWKFVNPSYITNSISKKLGRSGGSFRDMGIQASGRVDFDETIGLGYKLMLMNGNGINTSDNNKDKDFAFRFNFILPEGFDLGVSYYKGNYQEDEETSFDESALGFHILINNKIADRKLRVLGEYITASYNSITSEIQPWGYYLYGAYFVHPKLEIGVRYDYFENDKNAQIVISQNRTTFTIGYYFESKQRINLNYELKDDSSNPEVDNLITLQFQFAIQ